MLKKIVIVLSVLMLFSAVQKESAAYSTGAKVAGLIGWALAGWLMPGYILIAGGKNAEAPDLSYGSMDNIFFSGLGLYQSTRSSTNLKAGKRVFQTNGVALYTFAKKEGHSSTKDIFGLFRSGYEMDLSFATTTVSGEDWLKKWTDSDPASAFDIQSRLEFGLNWILYEQNFGDVLSFRIRNGLGSSYKFLEINSFYVRPALDIKLFNRITLNASLMRSFFGMNFGQLNDVDVPGGNSTLMDPKDYGIRMVYESRLELGGSVNITKYLGIGARYHTAVFGQQADYKSKVYNTWKTDGFYIAIYYLPKNWR